MTQIPPKTNVAGGNGHGMHRTRPIDRKAADALKTLRNEHGTWRAVSAVVGGENIGTLLRVSEGKRRASRRLLLTLNLVKPLPARRRDVGVRMPVNVAERVCAFLSFFSPMDEDAMRVVHKLKAGIKKTKGGDASH